MVTLKEVFDEIGREESGETDFNKRSDMERAMNYADGLRTYRRNPGGFLELDDAQKQKVAELMGSFENPYAGPFLQHVIDGVI
jgi:hypothetical protein